MTRRIHPLVGAAVLALVIAAVLGLAWRSQQGTSYTPAPPEPVVFHQEEQADGTFKLCTQAGACVLDESAPFTVTRPTAPRVLPGGAS